MQNPSSLVTSNQDDIHENLTKTVLKHLRTPFQKPISRHTLEAFQIAESFIKEHARPLIFDACCGVGESTRWIAKKHPDHCVIGVDKSLSRITRNTTNSTAHTALPNMLLLRADLNDFYRLAVNAGWRAFKQYILYPNPWPKAKHLQRRWHASPVFPYILALGGNLTLRSNWPLYLAEFKQALHTAGSSATVKEFIPSTPMTPFEAKYHQSGQALYALQTDLTDLDLTTIPALHKS